MFLFSRAIKTDVLVVHGEGFRLQTQSREISPFHRNVRILTQAAVPGSPKVLNGGWLPLEPAPEALGEAAP